MIFSDQNGLTYELNETDFTSKVIYSPKVENDIIIPRAVNFQSSEYTIISIDRDSFRKNFTIRSISFSQDSELQVIEKKAFSVSSIKKISFPPSLKKLKEGWCEETNYLNDIEISPNDKSYSYLDNKMIIGKSQTENNNYDTLIFVRRDIDDIKIPSFIKYIDPYAFDGCNNLHKIDFSDESELLSLGKCSFANTQLSSITIPPKFHDFKRGWCQETLHLTDVNISPKNHLFIRYDEDLVVGKSDPTMSFFDSLVFSSRSVIRIFVPSFIKYINPYAFEECEYMDRVHFGKHSKLISIGKCAFFSTGLTKIKIPRHVKEIGKSAFYDCSNLKKIIFSNHSELESIGKTAFNDCSIGRISIPKSISSIGVLAFSFCARLRTVEILSESFTCNEFSFKCCRCLTIVSIPNAKNIKISKNAFFGDSANLKIFIQSSSELETF